MTDPPIRADAIVVGCVTEDTPEIPRPDAPARAVDPMVGAIEKIDPREGLALAPLGADTQRLPEFILQFGVYADDRRAAQVQGMPDRIRSRRR